MTTVAAARQNDLHDHLTRYVNGTGGGRLRRLGSMVWPDAVYRAAAPGIIDRHRAFRVALTAADRAPGPGHDPVAIRVPVYAGANHHVHRMMAALVPLEEQLAGAYLHGSLAVDEQIAYSDVDALLILPDRVFDTADSLATVAARLGRLQQLMIDCDLLQHHGWFVLTQSDLSAYCDAYFPAELFRYSRSLLARTGGEVRLQPRDSTREYRAAWQGLIAATLRGVEAVPPACDAYALKGLLSQIMLLPCLYLQARDGTAVFKKFSFDLARADFAPELWRAMDRVSELRAAWHFDVSPVARFALTRFLSLRRVTTRWFGPAVPTPLRAKLTPEFWAAVARLIRAMDERLQAPP